VARTITKTAEPIQKIVANPFQSGIIAFQAPIDMGRYNRTKLIVVGCGGTGGRLVPALAQHVANHNANLREIIRNEPGALHNPMSLLLIDPDHVELKNLKRQNFYSFDINKNKADVLAERYSALYGITVESFPGFFEEAKSSIVNRHGGHNTIIFDCTDNAKARKSIEEYSQNALLISCGNEDTYGQVIVSTICDSSYMGSRLYDALATIERALKFENLNAITVVRSLPTLLELVRDFRDSGTESCTEMRLFNDQSMPINSLVAMLAFNVFYNVVGGKQLNYHQVNCSINNVSTTKFITVPRIAKNMFMQALYGPMTENKDALHTQFTAEYGRIMNSNLTEFKNHINYYHEIILPHARHYMRNRYQLNSEETAELGNIIMALDLGTYVPNSQITAAAA
jgi:molybdopterin/thiamine biosynthesis adenylyltransferase